MVCCFARCAVVVTTFGRVGGQIANLRAGLYIVCSFVALFGLALNDVSILFHGIIG